ncbi:MAG: DUF4835 family protein [Muribaculaceae bacterium]|nr:DUF4835 family protein [Muribaculaceae bacterium]MDE6521679.1 DUF4835 family protein [Muribaculaceae bacterium]MDE6785802.1 DUF4835 family protein [Muribaculaceae bacterium]
MKAKRIAKYIVASAAMMFSSGAFAQELNCTVEVNAQKIEGGSKSVFQTLQEAMSEYMNETRFSNATFANNEKIDCRLYLTVSEYADDRITGDLQVQLSRPVYNSTYTTTLFNFKDNRISFEYREGEPIIFNANTIDNNLTAILNYYAYLFLALDFDSFSPMGGEQYYERAASIVQAAQSLGEIGWKAFEDPKNRSGVLTSFTSPSTSSYRQMLYDYHRKGLDEMVTSPDKGRASITSSLSAIENVYKADAMSAALSIFRDSKLDELVNVYSKAPQTEREQVYKLLQPIYPSENDRLNKIRKGDENN